jgi:hypothetical protein
VVRAGEYQVTVRFAPAGRAGTVALSLGGARRQMPVEAGRASVVFEKVRLARGRGVLECDVALGESTVGALDVLVSSLR